MCHLYLHFTTDQENYQLIQTHQRKNCLQVHQHNLTPVQTYQQSNASPSPYDRSVIYKLTCMICNKAYVCQTSWNLKQHYKEHTCYIQNNNPQSAYALHILNNQHEYGPMEKTMTLLKPVKNTSLLTQYEQFFIQAWKACFRTKPQRTQPTAPDFHQPLPLSYMTLLVEQ